jgi:hypothetical protein
LYCRRRLLSGAIRQSVAAQANKVSAIRHIYEIRPRKDHRGVELISDALPFREF